MKNAAKILMAVLVLALLLGSVGCGGQVDTLAKIQNDGKIIMGTNAEFPPFEYRDASGEVVGFDVEIAKAIAEELGVELVIEDMDFGALIGALQSGKIDMAIAGMTVTEDRKQNVDFSVAYFDASQVMIVAADDDSIETTDDLVGLRIGVQEGTTGDLEASEVPDAEIFRYRKGIDAVMDLRNGNLDAVVIDMQPALVFVDRNDDIRMVEEFFTVEEYAIAVRKGDADLLAVIDGVIERIKADGTYQAIYDEFIGE